MFEEDILPKPVRFFFLIQFFVQLTAVKISGEREREREKVNERTKEMHGITSNVRHEERVVLNVYDLSTVNQYTASLGVGLFHTGIVVFGIEYSFSQSGISKGAPGNAGGPPLRQQIVLGKIRIASFECERMIDSLRDNFPPGSYDLITKNCNNFTDACSRLLLKKSIPAWVNRAAYFGKCLRCLVKDGDRSTHSRTEMRAIDSSVFSGAGRTLRNFSTQRKPPEEGTADERRRLIFAATQSRLRSKISTGGPTEGDS